MRQGVQTDDVGGAVSGALRATDTGAGEGVDGVETETEGGGVVHDGEYGKHADTVGDEVGCVERTDDALAQARGQPGFQLVQSGRVSAGVAMISTRCM